MTIPTWRRFAIAVFALGAAALLFHGRLAAALITRGDDALRNGDRTAAVRYYHRALAVDAGSVTAADRLAFYLAMRREPGDPQAAIDIASSGLRRHPGDAALLADRALAEQHVKRWWAAQHDFEQAGDNAHDARYDHLAARIALVRGRRNEAKRLFHLALRRDAQFAPARAALAELQ